jgi:signal transduction histidine kinase
MNRRAIAARLSLMVALAGLLPIAAVGIISTDLLRERTERASQQALQAIAEQAAARIAGFLVQQRELARAVAAVATEPGAKRRLEEVVLDAPGLGRVMLVGQASPESERPKGLEARALADAFEGKEVASEIYLARDTTPTMDICVPARALPAGQAVCAQLDLLELWRFVQRIRIGNSGYALVLDRRGRLIASGAGVLRAAILTGEPVPESPFAMAAVRDQATAPTRYVGPDGHPVIAGWARLPDQGWAIVVEQPVHEALRSARTAQWLLGGVLLLALTVSVVVGVSQSQRVLRELEIEERWRTAGRIAAGITHDLGHRLRILEQTAALAEAGNPAFLPRIRDNLRSEVGTLKKFVAEFSDLSRNVAALELIPLELGAFLESIRRTATPHAEAAGVRLEAKAPPSPLWVSADRYTLERALLNLVSNAIEASPRGAVVQLSAGEQDGRCVIEVVDRGAGIAADRVPHLFDAFVSTKRTGAHLGMGLPNVKRIVEAHRGQVWVHSDPKIGTTFKIGLRQVSPLEKKVEGRTGS